jgi:GTP-binding protein Era
VSEDFVAGFVALVGPPNAGKSTLLNRLLGERLAIVSAKPQTTRDRLLGVVHRPNAQIALVDTPGLHHGSSAGRGRSRLNRYMMDEALSALADVDVIVAVVDAQEKPGGEQRMLLEEVKKANKPSVLALNKVDAFRDKRRLLPQLETWQKSYEWRAMVPISAVRGDNVAELEKQIIACLPKGAPLFDEDTLTDRSERWLGAELVREQVFLLTKKEVPYAIAVSVDEWEDRGRDVRVAATIHVAKDAHKGILVGERGRMIREIGSRARAEIGKLLGRECHLSLFVRVDEGWTDDPAALRELGYDSKGRS